MGEGAGPARDTLPPRLVLGVIADELPRSFGNDVTTCTMKTEWHGKTLAYLLNGAHSEFQI